MLDVHNERKQTNHHSFHMQPAHDNRVNTILITTKHNPYLTFTELLQEAYKDICAFMISNLHCGIWNYHEINTESNHAISNHSINVVLKDYSSLVTRMIK